MKKTFKTTIPSGDELGIIRLPFDPVPVFGKLRAPVRVTVKGHTYRSTIFQMGDGPFVPLRKSNREAAGLVGGEKVSVTLELDTEKREAKPPADLVRALKAVPGAMEKWKEMSFTHQREHVEAIADAKKPETRQRRIENAVRMVAARAAKKRIAARAAKKRIAARAATKSGAAGPAKKTAARSPRKRVAARPASKAATPQGSVTSTRCTCSWLGDAADDPASPIVFNPELNEYDMIQAGDPHSLARIRHCPWCGGAAPLSKRPRFFAHITHSERTRLLELTSGVTTFEQAIERFGEPDEDHVAGLTTMSRATETEPSVLKSYRVIRYLRLSETADVDFTDYGPEGGLRVSLTTRYLGRPKR